MASFKSLIFKSDDDLINHPYLSKNDKPNRINEGNEYENRNIEDLDNQENWEKFGREIDRINKLNNISGYRIEHTNLTTSTNHTVSINNLISNELYSNISKLGNTTEAPVNSKRRLTKYNIFHP